MSFGKNLQYLRRLSKNITNPSNMDVILISNTEKAILFLESKFSEFLFPGQEDISYTYKNEFGDEIYNETFLSKIGLKFISKKDADKNYKWIKKNSKTGKIEEYFTVGSAIKNQSIYVAGIKQMISHFIGIRNFTKFGPDITELRKLDASYSIFLGEILFDSFNFDKSEKLLTNYIEKYELLVNQVNKWYNINGVRFGCSVDTWPDTCTTLEQYKTYLGNSIVEELIGKDVTQENITDAQKKILKDKFDDYKVNNRWNGELTGLKYNNYVFESTYGTQVSPYSVEKDYLKEAQFFKNVAKAQQGEASYIPGLSNAIMYEGSAYPTAEIGCYTAGVDCIGFVQRSVAYGTSETTIYSALKNSNYFFEPPTWGNNTVPAKTATSNPSARDNFQGNKNYAVKFVEKVSPSSSESILNSDNQEDTIYYFNSLKYAVPGDIVWYNGPHIMIVGNISIPDDTSKFSEENVSVLESCYSNTFTFYGVNKSRTLKKLKTSSNGLIKNWEIWRQKTN